VPQILGGLRQLDSDQLEDSIGTELHFGALPADPQQGTRALRAKLRRWIFGDKQQTIGHLLGPACRECPGETTPNGRFSGWIEQRVDERTRVLIGDPVQRLHRGGGDGTIAQQRNDMGHDGGADWTSRIEDVPNAAWFA
jgi:hypothetical protein